MNKKAQAGWESGRWMIRVIGHIFFFVLVASFIFSIVSSHIHRDVNAGNAVSFSAVNEVAECMKQDDVFTLEKAKICNRWNSQFGAVYTLNGQSSNEVNPVYTSKGLCDTFKKNYVCGKDVFFDEAGNKLVIDWVMETWKRKEYS